MSLHRFAFFEVALLALVLVPVVEVRAASFRRGDANQDSTVDISDSVFVLGSLFLGTPAPGCLDSADSNDDGRVDVADPVWSLSFLFRGGPAPPAPGPHDCGCDPTPDPIDCALYATCPGAEDCSCDTNAECPRGFYCSKEDGDCDGSGVCAERPFACPRIFDPVCGCDGVTYGNRCEAAAAGVSVAHEGACESICGGIAGIPCEKGEFCDFPPGTCDIVDNAGVCVPVPEVCPEIFDPVCGCDGVTYGNDCERIRARVQKSHDGECER